MRSVCTLSLLVIALCLCTSAQLSAQDFGYGFWRQQPPSATRLLPPVIANKGQFNEAVRFIIPGPNGTVIFTEDSVIVVLGQKDSDPPPQTPAEDGYLSLLPSEVREAAVSRRMPLRPAQAAEMIRIAFVDSDSGVKVEGLEEQPAKAHHLVGSESSKWIKGIPVFKGVAYRGVWPGVDLAFSADGGKITCSMQGTNLEKAKLESAAGKTLTSVEASALISRALGGEWAVRKGRHMMIDQQGIVASGTVYSPLGTTFDKPSDYDTDCFALSADYSSGKPSWITFLGGNSDDVADAVCIDRHGYVYVTGFTSSENFPVAGRAYKNEYNGYQDYFTATLKPSGGSITYSTFLGVGGGGLGLEPFAAKWTPPTGSKPEKLLAIMIDDGREQAQIKPFLDLGIPVTFALMPWVDPTCIKQIKSRGSATFLHAPMEALGSVNTRSEEICITQTEKQVQEMLEGWLALTPGVVGVSNHRGSAATSDPETVRRVALFAKKHGLMVYDSNTSPVSIGVNVCRDMKVPCLQQDFFLDETEISLVRARMLAMAALAERTGYSTCICHVGGRTTVPDGIRSVIAELQAKGFRFVTVPELYKTLTGK